MKFITNSRQFHKSLAPWVFLPLFISALTGTFYRISKDLLGYSRDEVHWLMSLHEGEWLGDVYKRQLLMLEQILDGNPW